MTSNFDCVDGVCDDDEVEGLIFAGAEVCVAGTEPNVLTPSDLIGGTAAGEDEIGAVTSSIDPKVTDDPDFIPLVGLRAPATPSLNETPWPSVLGRLEWVG